MSDAEELELEELKFDPWPHHVVQRGSPCWDAADLPWLWSMCPVCLCMPNVYGVWVHRGVEDLYH
jgi:hypothetical protein